jgi:flagellar motor switch protein FliN
MNTTVKKLALPELQATPHEAPLHPNYLGLVGDIEVQCTVRIGSLTLSIKELRQLHQGQLLPLAQKTTEPVDIILNDHLIAKGELMSCDNQYAVCITELLS